ncbi:MAG: FG-GAP repeat protein [Woeseia sp.]
MVTMMASVTMAALLSTPVHAQSSTPRDFLKLVPDSTDVAAFGESVDVDGDTAVIGAIDDDGQGAVYVFLREGERWIQQARLTGVSGFGESVAIDGDTLLVGAPHTREAYVYSREARNSTWYFRVKFTADNLLENSTFGKSVALYEGTAVVGAWNEAPYGAAYVFATNDGVNWTRQAKLLGSGNRFDTFGTSVAISGDTIIVGDRSHNEMVAPEGQGAGAAFVFTRSGGDWTRTAKLLPQEPSAAFTHFGNSVAIDSNVAVVGAPRDRQLGDLSGAAYVFTRHSGAWSVTTKLLPPEGGTEGEFGTSVGVAGGTILVAEPWRDDEVRDDGTFRTGAAYFFSRGGGSWSEETQVLPDDTRHPGVRFGHAVAIDGSTSLIGAPGFFYRGDGAAYVVSEPSGVFGLHCPRDLNGEGPALVVVSPDGRVRVKDMNGVEVAAFDIGISGRIVASRVLPDRNGNAVPELVVLTKNPNRIVILDLHTGDRLAQSGELADIGTAVDLELLADTGGTWAGAAAILGASPSRTMLHDTSALTPINLADFDNYVQPTDLAIYPDLDGNGEPELAVLGENKEAWGSDKIELRDSLSGVKLYDIWLGSGWEVLQQALVSDVNGNATPEVAVLRVPDARDKVTVVMRDIGSKQWLRTMYFDPNYPPIRLLTLPDITGNAADEVVVFGQRFNGGNQKAQLIDSATGAFEGVIFYSSNFDGLDLVRCDDMNGNGADELAMLGRRKSDGLYRVIVKDARTRERLGYVNFR